MKKKRALAASRDPEQLDMFDNAPKYSIRESNQRGNIAFHSGGTSSDEMLKITPNGFYVRGVLVPQDEKEASIVYNAFREWMVYNALTRSY